MTIPITVLRQLAPHGVARDFGVVHDAGRGPLEKRFTAMRSQAQALGADAIVGLQIHVEGGAVLAWGNAVKCGPAT